MTKPSGGEFSAIDVERQPVLGGGSPDSSGAPLPRQLTGAHLAIELVSLGVYLYLATTLSWTARLIGEATNDDVRAGPLGIVEAAVWGVVVLGLLSVLGACCASCGTGSKGQHCAYLGTAIPALIFSIAEIVVMVALHTVVECHIPEDPLADFAGSGDMSSGVKAVLSIDATAVVHYVLSMFTIWALAKFTCRMYAVAAGSQRVCCPTHELPTDVNARLHSTDPCGGCGKIGIVAATLSALVLGVFGAVVYVMFKYAC